MQCWILTNLFPGERHIHSEDGTSQQFASPSPREQIFRNRRGAAAAEVDKVVLVSPFAQWDIQVIPRLAAEFQYRQGLFQSLELPCLGMGVSTSGTMQLVLVCLPSTRPR